MKVRTALLAGLWLASAAVLPLGLALADDKAHDGHDHDAMGSPAEMEAWMKAMTPGAEHKGLEGMVGTWDATVKMWMDPSQPPSESTGTSVNTMALGGRYVEQHYDGMVMGQPFQGVGFTGYDNIKKKYVGMWMDTMSTTPMITWGTMAADMKSSQWEGSMDDPLTGKPVRTESKVTIVSNDHHVFEMFGPGADGKMMKTMQIDYHRKK